MGKHRNPWGGLPIDDSALKHLRPDGTAITVAQVARIDLVSFFEFPPDTDEPTYRNVAGWDDSQQPYEVGIDTARKRIVHCMALAERPSHVAILDRAMPGWDARNPGWREGKKQEEGQP
jgi:hypothetical protein